MCFSIVLLLTVVMVSDITLGYVIVYTNILTGPIHTIHLLYHFAYLLLPTLICDTLACIVIYLEAHCDKGEYVSFAADQRPLDPRDWDMKSGTAAQQDEASTWAGCT